MYLHKNVHMRLDEFQVSSIVRRSRRTTEDSWSRRIVRIVFILETLTQGPKLRFPGRQCD